MKTEPSSLDMLRLEELLERHKEELEEWFTHFYGQKFINDNQFEKNLEQFNASEHDDDLMLSLAWNTVATYQQAFQVDFKWEKYRHTFGELFE